MVSARKKKNQQKRQLSQLDEPLNHFAFGNSVNVNLLEIENLEQQTKGQPNGFERVDIGARQN